MDAGQRGLPIREVDQADPGDRSVEAAFFELEQVLAVGLQRLHRRKACLGRDASGVLEDGRRDVGGQHAAGRPDQSRGGERLPTCSGSDIENAVTVADTGGAEHGSGRFTEPVLDRRPPSVPGLRGLLPLCAGGPLEHDRVEADGHGVPSV
nr:hypothetical protein [Kribbella sp. VKM Ac-2568]